MRVTTNTFPNALVDQLGRLATRQFELQKEAASGQRLTLPEDDPTSMRRVLDMQAEGTSLNQYLRNVWRHQELAVASFDAMKGLKTIVDRANEIATLADGLKSPDELTAYATEVNELIKQAAQLGNAQNRGDYIFAGTLSSAPPFSITLDLSSQVTAVAYSGNQDLAESEIAEDVTLTAQAVGANATGSGTRGLVEDTRVGADLFGHLISLRDHLSAGDTNAIATIDRTQLGADEDNFLYHFGTNGVLQSRLETTEAILKNRGQSLDGLISQEADADLAETLVKFSAVETAYKAALQSAGSILGQSLLDFLR